MSLLVLEDCRGFDSCGYWVSIGLKVFELCLSSPTVSNFFTLLFLPFSTVSEPFHRWGGAFSTLGVPFGVRFRRLIRF